MLAVSPKVAANAGFDQAQADLCRAITSLEKIRSSDKVTSSLVALLADEVRLTAACLQRVQGKPPLPIRLRSRR